MTQLKILLFIACLFSVCLFSQQKENNANALPESLFDGGIQITNLEVENVVTPIGLDID